MKVLYLVLLSISIKGYSFSLFTAEGAKFEQETVAVNYVSANCNSFISASSLAGLIEDSIDEYWGRVPYGYLNLQVGSSVSSGGNPANGTIRIDCGDEGTDSYKGIASATNSGQSMTYCDVTLNTFAGTFFDSSRQTQKAITAHEIGHCIGIGHSGLTNQLMSASVVREGIGEDDIAAYTYLYSASASDDLFGCGSIAKVGPSGPNYKLLIVNLILALLMVLAMKFLVVLISRLNRNISL